MAKRTSLKKTIIINAPITGVCQALTDRRMIKQYFFGVETSGDWEEGNTIYYKGEWQHRI